MSAFLEPTFKPVVRWLPTYERHRYLADPFGLKVDNRLILLAEQYDHKSQRGHIAFVTEDQAGAFTQPAPAIVLAEHVSYPYLMTHDGDIYCIPEASTAREVRLFRATSFPRAWELASVLVRDFSPLDPTVFEHEGRWWLLCCDGDTGDSTALHAFYAPDLRGPWSPHAANPVKTDARSSRPAGRPFVVGGALYRPAQDCSRTYGGAVAITRILRLTPTDFAEEVVRLVEPDPRGPFPDGLHTINTVDDITIIDGKRLVFVWDVLVRALKDHWKYGIWARHRARSLTRWFA